MKKTEKPWKTRPISPTCERIVGMKFGGYKLCDAPTSFAYPAMGGGWMALCEICAQPHLPQASSIYALITAGETFE